MPIKKPNQQAKSTDTMYQFYISKKKRGRINLDPEYQREVVWNEENMSDFIDSLMKNKVASALIFNKSLEGEYVCIDGKQRSTSIFRYYENEFPWDNDGELIYYSKKPKNVKGRVMTKQEQTDFEDKELFWSEYTDLTYEEQVSIFEANHAGKALSSGEELLSCFKKKSVAAAIKETATKHKKNLGLFIDVTRKKDVEFISRLIKIVYDEINIDKRNVRKFMKNTRQDKLISYIKQIDIFLTKFLKISSESDMPFRKGRGKNFSGNGFVGSTFLMFSYCILDDDEYKWMKSKDIALFAKKYLEYLHRKAEKDGININNNSKEVLGYLIKTAKKVYNKYLKSKKSDSESEEESSDVSDDESENESSDETSEDEVIVKKTFNRKNRRALLKKTKKR